MLDDAYVYIYMLTTTVEVALVGISLLGGEEDARAEDLHVVQPRGDTDLEAHLRRHLHCEPSTAAQPVSPGSVLLLFHQVNRGVDECGMRPPYVVHGESVLRDVAIDVEFPGFGRAVEETDGDALVPRLAPTAGVVDCDGDHEAGVVWQGFARRAGDGEDDWRWTEDDGGDGDDGGDDEGCTETCEDVMVDIP